MKIVMVGPVFPYRGGIAHYTTLLAKSMESAGHLVRVISFRRQYPSWLYPGASDRDPSKEQIRVSADYLLDPLYPWTWLQAAQRIRNEQPDAVIFQYWTTFWAVQYAVIARALGKDRRKLAYLVHNVMPHEPRFWDRALSRLALGCAEKFIVQTEKETERLRALIPTARISCTPHPVYTMFSGQTSSQEQARERLGLSEGVPVLLFFGIVRPYKGLRHLLQAVSLLRQQGQEVHLLVAGEFWEPEHIYHALAEELGIGKQIHWYNYYIPNEEVPLFFSAADVFVAPYIDGTQSGAVKMAVGFGMPVVMTDCILDESLRGGTNVWQANTGDAHSLAQAIISAVENGTKPSTAAYVGDGWEQVVRAIEEL